MYPIAPILISDQRGLGVYAIEDVVGLVDQKVFDFVSVSNITLLLLEFLRVGIARYHKKETVENLDRPQRNDSFDLLRLIAALMVLWSHQHVLLGFPEPAVGAIEGSIGTLGVCIFFGISGYLNGKSLLRRKSATSFLIGRAFRNRSGACGTHCPVRRHGCRHNHRPSQFLRVQDAQISASKFHAARHRGPFARRIQK